MENLYSTSSLNSSLSCLVCYCSSRYACDDQREGPISSFHLHNGWQTPCSCPTVRGPCSENEHQVHSVWCAIALLEMHCSPHWSYWLYFSWIRNWGTSGLPASWSSDYWYWESPLIGCTFSDSQSQSAWLSSAWGGGIRITAHTWPFGRSHLY
jgi:hypothetical protein